jgi:hypothetical protein
MFLLSMTKLLDLFVLILKAYNLVETESGLFQWDNTRLPTPLEVMAILAREVPFQGEGLVDRCLSSREEHVKAGKL